MAPEKESEKPRAPRRPRYAPGYIQARRALEKIKRFKALIAHDQKWGGHFQHVQPLAELLPPNTLPERQQVVLEETINKSIPLVSYYFWLGGIYSEIGWTDNTMEWDYEKGDARPKNKRRSADAVLDYFLIKRNDKNGALFELQMHACDQALGYYEDMLSISLRRKLNPITWLGFIVSLPVRILDAAGINSQDSQGPAMAIFGWVLRIAFLAALALGSLYFGKKIPWTDVLKFVK